MSSSKLFIDRKLEMEQALIVCEQIIRGKKGGVLVLGGRASGKTSFLDELRKQLTDRQIASCKIPLNIGLVQPGNELQFISTVLSELLKATDEAGLMDKGLLRSVRDLLGGIKIGEIGIDIPGISFVAKASEMGKLTRAPFVVLRDGLDDFVKMLDKEGKKGTKPGVILTIDEGDALTTNKDLLQIIRNVFQDFTRVGLVVAGSVKLLTQVSDVYSPWARGFRKVLLGPYSTNSDVDQAIGVPLELVREELKAQGVEMDVVHRSFDSLLRVVSSKEPMAINVLCHYAYELATKRPKVENGRYILYLRIDRELMDEVINQLRGSGEYDQFLSELKPEESALLRILSRCQRGANVDELSTLLKLNEFDKRLQQLPMEKVTDRIRVSPNFRLQTKNILDSLSTKGESHQLSVVTTRLTGMSLYEIEDQWIKAYFTYGWDYEDVNLELGISPEFNGIRVFGDPVSTLIHSTVFPRMASWLSPKTGFRAHTGPKDGMELKVEEGRAIVGLNYQRTADGISYHLAFQPSQEADVEFWKGEIVSLASSLNHIGLIDAFKVFVKYSRAK